MTYLRVIFYCVHNSWAKCESVSSAYKQREKLISLVKLCTWLLSKTSHPDNTCIWFKKCIIPLLNRSKEPGPKTLSAGWDTILLLYVIMAFTIFPQRDLLNPQRLHTSLQLNIIWSQQCQLNCHRTVYMLRSTNDQYCFFFKRRKEECQKSSCAHAHVFIMMLSIFC